MDHELLASLNQNIDDLNELLERLIEIISDVYQ